MAYFDNASTTYPKPDCVYKHMDDFYRNCGGSYGRGQYRQALSAGGLVSDTRARIQMLLHCQSKQVIFTPTATVALNIIIQGMIKKGAKNIYISPFEHNAVTRVLHSYEKNGLIQVKTLNVSNDFEFDIERIRYQFDASKPDMVVISHVSNVVGLVAPIESIFTLAKKYDAITLADMAQSAGLVDCNVGQACFDFAVFAGHKTLLGPTGISGFVMKPDFDIPPIIFGGTGYDSANQDMPSSLPERYEMGTQNVIGIAGLNASLRWIEEKGIKNLWKIEHNNRQKLLELMSRYPFVTTVGNVPGKEYVGIVSCLIDGISSDSAGTIFNERNIAVRTGLQCAPLAHKFLGTFPAGTIRFSVSCLTTDFDFEELQNALESISQEY